MVKLNFWQIGPSKSVSFLMIYSYNIKLGLTKIFFLVSTWRVYCNGGTPLSIKNKKSNPDQIDHCHNSPHLRIVLYPDSSALWDMKLEDKLAALWYPGPPATCDSVTSRAVRASWVMWRAVWVSWVMWQAVRGSCDKLYGCHKSRDELYRCHVSHDTLETPYRSLQTCISRSWCPDYVWLICQFTSTVTFHHTLCFLEIVSMLHSVVYLPCDATNEINPILIILRLGDVSNFTQMVKNKDVVFPQILPVLLLKA